ncbi:RNA polymerase sigma factor [Pedobacter sp. AW31-3R]|uniref:RNA polymerase sigma factor n=1 Tax=Pedobacter sp. AW31-3R TaxID=3445781 RepID=UPI003F9F1F5A
MDSERYYHLTDEELRLEFCPPDIDTPGKRRKQKHAYIETYRRFWGRVFYVAYKHLQRQKDAEEAVYQVFLFLWNKREEFKIESLDAHLAAITRFTVYRIMADARAKRELEAERMPVWPEVLEPDANIGEQFLLKNIPQLRNQLPEQIRMTFRPLMKKVKSRSENGFAEGMNNLGRKITALFKRSTL